MRTWALWIATLLAAGSLACTQSDQDKARGQARQARDQANRDLHQAAHDARQGFDKANQAVTKALEGARQDAHEAIHNANRNPQRKNTDRDQRDSGPSNQ
jgi:F0F1-type ATP synthase membrane subunit b/b'